MQQSRSLGPETLAATGEDTKAAAALAAVLLGLVLALRVTVTRRTA